MTDTANAPERIWAWPHGYRVVAPEGSDDITQYRWVPNFDVTDIGEGQAWTAPTPQMPGATKYVLATHCDELVAAAKADLAEAQAKIARLNEALNDIIMCDHHNFYDGPPPRFVQIARAALQENSNE